MMSISLTDYVVKGSHIIDHSNEDNLECERRAIDYARTMQSRNVSGKLATCSLMGKKAIIKCFLSYQTYVVEAMMQSHIEKE